MESNGGSEAEKRPLTLEELKAKVEKIDQQIAEQRFAMEGNVHSPKLLTEIRKGLIKKFEETRAGYIQQIEELQSKK